MEREAANRLISQKNMNQRQLHEEKMELRIAENHKLCGQFATWATEHDIPYNSPSPFARGWLLGKGDGPPSWSFSGYGVQDSGNSTYSLLIHSSKPMRELVVRSVRRPRRGGKYHQRFSKPADIQRYSTESIETSIAEFSFKHHIPWDASGRY